MKRTVLSLIAALAMVLSLCAAAPLEASAATRRNHDEKTFTITADEFLREFAHNLEYNGCDYTMELAEAFSDSNAQFYDMYDRNGSYAMTVVLYPDLSTGKLDTVRLYCAAEDLKQIEEDGRFFGMLVAYVVSNPNMTEEKWDAMFTDDTRTGSGSGCVYSGEFDSVSYSLWIWEGDIEFIIT